MLKNLGGWEGSSLAVSVAVMVTNASRRKASYTTKIFKGCNQDE